MQANQEINKKNYDKVCKLQRSIYGLKQASRSWNLRFDESVKEFGFIKNEDEPCVYKKVSGSAIVFMVLYVDDILLIGNDIPTLQNVKSWLGKYFSMKDLGEVAYILGIKIYKDRSEKPNWSESKCLHRQSTEKVQYARFQEMILAYVSWYYSQQISVS